jgi:hypothetical protein
VIKDRGMIETRWCSICEEATPSRSIVVSLPGQQVEDFHLCEGCWRLLECGCRRTSPDGALEKLLAGSALRLTEPELRSLIESGLQADGDNPVRAERPRELGRHRLVRGELLEIDADLKDAVAASALGDWTGTLEAVRMIHGRAVIARRALEGILGMYPVAADLPPIVRAVQAVGQIISDREVDSLPPAELRARMHAVLHEIDRELQAFLDPPEEGPVPTDLESDMPPGGMSASERF